ncbi:hypothetical protein [Pseudorhodobacter ferrugineus]|uniref:hypothetical protein n=1 Tax=Pseudorhodobacter ferrugineus TaxID=77008 RepID=UPI0003B406A4|nr:hypothetical protein [Pseudorhodobacter ferrugineus]
MDPKTPTEKPTQTNNQPSSKNRLVGEALVASGLKNNEPSMVKAGNELLQKAVAPTKPTDS